jgi:YHS domain-containing protein
VSREEDHSVARDPVCGMDVDPKKAAAQSSYQGQMVYFCAVECKVTFDKDPARYVSSR